MFPDPTTAPTGATTPPVARLVAGNDGQTLRPLLVDHLGRPLVVVAAIGPLPPITGAVAVTNLPPIQPVAGTVAVANFPATQPVSGAVSVSNLPALQAVSVGNFPANQPVSGTVAVSNLPATQPVSGTVSVANLPATQAVSGSVNVANLPAVQPTRGEAADRARAGSLFSAATAPATPSNVADTALALFRNPANSGKTCYVDAWSVATATAAYVQALASPTVSAPGTAATPVPRNPAAAATPAGVLSAGPALTLGTLERAGWTAAGGSLGDEPRGAWVVPPGGSIAWLVRNATLVAGLFGQASVRVAWWEA